MSLYSTSLPVRRQQLQEQNPPRATPTKNQAQPPAERKRNEAASAAPQADAPVAKEPGAVSDQPVVSPRVRKAWGQIAGALLLDSSLVPIASPWVERCESEDIQRVLEAILELHADIEAEITPGTVMTALVDHPSREIVGKIVQHSESAESPRLLLNDAISFLKRTYLEAERDTIQARLSGSEIDENEQKNLLQRFMVIQEELQKIHKATEALASTY